MERADRGAELSPVVFLSDVSSWSSVTIRSQAERERNALRGRVISEAAQVPPSTEHLLVLGFFCTVLDLVNQGCRGL
jgi:hypothetical protein